MAPNVRPRPSSAFRLNRMRNPTPNAFWLLAFSGSTRYKAQSFCFLASKLPCNWMNTQTRSVLITHWGSVTTRSVSRSLSLLDVFRHTGTNALPHRSYPFLLLSWSLLSGLAFLYPTLALSCLFFPSCSAVRRWFRSLLLSGSNCSDGSLLGGLHIGGSWDR
jgi:hypothetical protein